MTNRNDRDSSPCTSEQLLDFLSEVSGNAADVTSKELEITRTLSNCVLCMYSESVHTDNQRLQTDLPPEEASRVEKQRDRNLKNASRVLKKSQKSVNRSRRSWYSLAICSFLLFLFLLGAVLFLNADVFFPDSSSLDNSSEMCYTEPYDNNAGNPSPQNLP